MSSDSGTKPGFEADWCYACLNVLFPGDPKVHPGKRYGKGAPIFCCDDRCNRWLLTLDAHQRRLAEAQRQIGAQAVRLFTPIIKRLSRAARALRMTDQAAYEAGKREERADLIAWLEQDDVIDLIRQGAHEGSSDA